MMSPPQGLQPKILSYIMSQIAKGKQQTEIEQLFPKAKFFRGSAEQQKGASIVFSIRM